MTDAYEIRVTVGDYGYVEITQGSGTSVANLTNGKLLSVSGDIVISKSDVKVEVIEKDMEIERVTWGGNTITLYLTEGLSSAAISNINNWNATDDVTAVADKDGAAPNPAFYSASASGKQITLTFSGELLAEGDKITLANATHGLAQVTGATATNVCPTTNNIIVLDANGAAHMSNT